MATRETKVSDILYIFDITPSPQQFLFFCWLEYLLYLQEAKLKANVACGEETKHCNIVTLVK